jgi:hypothetical protein
VVHAAYVTTGTTVPAGPGVPGSVAATDAGAGVTGGADGEPVHPAMLIALMSRIVKITADFNDIVPQLLSEAIIIVIDTNSCRSTVFDLRMVIRP